jgi:hypothetical protein
MNNRALDNLIKRAREAAPTDEPEACTMTPPGFARTLVHRWLQETTPEIADSWTMVSRRGLAFALALMFTSVLWQSWPSRPPVLMETSASATVLLSLFPR